MYFLFIYSLLLFLLLNSALPINNEPNIILEENHDLIVNLPNGKIQGHVLSTQSNNTYYSFQQVPYASPPIGELRFKEPIPPENWKGILKTTKNTKICPQNLMIEDPKENEDCLYLNVFTPSLPSTTNVSLPVIFYIYGGMWRAGDPTFATYDFQLLVEQGVIVVLANYRTGTIGHLTTADGIIPGNIFLRDQQFALKWVQQNIHLFGGDPAKVTLVGHSSGAVAVGAHVLNKRSKGLFRAAILQSASPLINIEYQIAPRYFAFELGKKLDNNFDSRNSSTDLLKLLQKIPIRTLMTTNIKMPSNTNLTSVVVERPYFWRLIIEDPTDENSFITPPMHDNVRDGNFYQVPMLIGITSEEFLGAHEIYIPIGPVFDSHPELIPSKSLNLKNEARAEYGKEIRNIYAPNTTFQSKPTALTQYFGDREVTVPTMRFADLSSKYVDVYFYQFSYDGPLGGNKHPIKYKGLEKVGHTSELGYLNLYRVNRKEVYPASDWKTSQRMVKLWTNFVKYLNPTPKADSLLQNITWPKLTPNTDDDIVYLDIDINLSLKKNPRHYNQWKVLMDKYLVHPLSNI